MSGFKKTLPFLTAMAAVFYILPLLMANTSLSIFILLYAMPALCLVISIWYGIKRPFTPLWPISVALMFIPSVFIYFNSSALIYSLVFGLFALFGNIISQALIKFGRSKYLIGVEAENKAKKAAAKAAKKEKRENLGVKNADTRNTSKKKLARMKKQK